MTIYTIYKITNNINDKEYIGYTKNRPQGRWAMHKYQAKSNRSNAPIHEAIRKLGISNFRMEILLQSNTDILDMEDTFIDELDTIDNGYNAKKGGQPTKNTIKDYSYTSKCKKQNRIKVSGASSYENTTIEKQYQALQEQFGKMMYEHMTNEGMLPNFDDYFKHLFQTIQTHK